LDQTKIQSDKNTIRHIKTQRAEPGFHLPDFSRSDINLPGGSPYIMRLLAVGVLFSDVMLLEDDCEFLSRNFVENFCLNAIWLLVS